MAGIRIVVLVALCTVAALYQAGHLTALADSDIWWHLRTGTWILQNHAIPRQGLFSQFPSLPWVDSNWGFDLLVGAAEGILGLRALPVLFMALQVAVVAALFLLAGGTRQNFWRAAILVVVAQCCLPDLKPRPALISVLFFALELALLLRSRRSGQMRALLWLPLVFLVWVNLDRQFAYGLLALALFSLATAVEYVSQRSGRLWSEADPDAASLRMCMLAFGACVLATLASPYTYHLHELIWQSATSTAVDYYLPELHGMRFRQFPDYLLMLLLMTAFLTLGRRRSRDLFQLSLLIVAAVISFRFQRDTWLVALVAIAILGSGSVVEDRDEVRGPSPRRWEGLIAAALVLLAVVAGALRLPTRSETLMTKIGETFPVRASDYVRKNRLPQPLFNTYRWGGFLIWYLPEYPVIIDSRLDLYPDDVSVPYFKLTQAEIPLQSHPGFVQAQTFLLEAKSPMAEALANLPDFQVVYRDDVAWVLVRRNLLP